MDDLPLDLRLFASAGDLLLAELDRLQDHLRIPRQVIHGDGERVGQRDQHTGAGYGLVPLVLADRLRGHTPADLCLQPAQRQSGGGPGHLQSSTDHGTLPPWPPGLQNIKKRVVLSMNVVRVPEILHALS